MTPRYVATFKLFLMCSNCLRKSSKMINIPDEADAPTDVDDLVYSGVMQTLRFQCMQCESVIAEVVGIEQMPLPDETCSREGIAA
mgnify:CR=1 FL=1